MLLGKTALSKFNPQQQICWQYYVRIAISTMINMSNQTKASHFFRRLTVNVRQLLPTSKAWQTVFITWMNFNTYRFSSLSAKLSSSSL